MGVYFVQKNSFNGFEIPDSVGAVDFDVITVKLEDSHIPDHV